MYYNFRYLSSKGIPRRAKIKQHPALSQFMGQKLLKACDCIFDNLTEVEAYFHFKTNHK